MGNYDLVRGTAWEEKQSETEKARKSDDTEDAVASEAVKKESSEGNGKEETHYSSWIESRRALSKGDQKQRSPSKAILSEAVRKAKALGAVEKMKVCYRSDQDEWWISIYHKVGAAVDVKRFVWDLNSQTLKPFLVIKRVSKSKLDSELEKQEPGESCEIVTLRTERP